jgi:hypothetical protein
VRGYLVVTGTLFAVIFVAHIWEVLDRRSMFASDLLVLGVSAGLSVWAWRLVVSSSRKDVP